MAFARTGTVTFQGAAAIPVEVQVQIAGGLPTFSIVGLANKAVSESRERVRAALSTVGVALPPKRVLVSLAPADLTKDGSHFDLPIALGILAALGQVAPELVADCCVMGELSLDGRLEPVPGILPAAMTAVQHDRTMVCPARQGGEALLAGVRVVMAAPTLGALVAHLRGTEVLAMPDPPAILPEPARPDLADVRGHQAARRALEIAAVGRHNLLLVGPPGSGKSMLAERLPGLLPPLSPAEALDVAIIRSLSGALVGGGISAARPFRSPHHSASQAALVGGGSRLRPGEVSLAHRGVLFLDELPEFPRNGLEALRQPLEAGEVAISRADGKAVFPADFQLIAAMNPCPCGYLGVDGRECGRSPACGNDYRAKISGPLLDRIDMFVEVTPIPPRELVRAQPGESSATVARRVLNATARAIARGQSGNAALPFDALRAAATSEAMDILERAAVRVGLSTRGFVRVLRVARSIADLADSDRIERSHVAEALAYRSRVF